MPVMIALKDILHEGISVQATWHFEIRENPL
jgi:hypothetical protein